MRGVRKNNMIEKKKRKIEENILIDGEDLFSYASVFLSRMKLDHHEKSVLIFLVILFTLTKHN